ncbi:FinO bacterial conjugation repressor domain (plasmid) [Candidatus Trichorickettsia mobilis]|uniref:FinO bacterial conjugation repressor domain n=1 Tax=Candidatus Trichorickettsia mobilis TaxID=1346319 RepID=A0ABZ0UTW8_9RICK|nr:ProQ/FINO family protein [Candidatus Trichorickettsia mobilis]WPY01475.1 FinO bacterial conjugation repressor domain [Candidatus Trichorickettsia mobilis]
MTEEPEKPKPKLTLKLGGDKLKAIQEKLKTEVPKAPKVKKEKMPREEYKEVLDLVRRKFAKAFPKCTNPIRMLKLGIHKDLCKRLKMDEYKIWRFLYVYTKKKKYTLAMKVGEPRYSLSGKEVGKVMESEVHVPKKKQVKGKRPSNTAKPKQNTKTSS